MTTPLRVMLAVIAVLVVLMVVRGLRKGSFEVMDSLFWLTLSLLLVVAALFPRLVYAMADLLGIESPANLVFLAGIVLLLVRVFQQDRQLTVLRQKLTTLVQNEALKDHTED